jgi:hypothetical protein
MSRSPRNGLQNIETQASTWMAAITAIVGRRPNVLPMAPAAMPASGMVP